MEPFGDEPVGVVLVAVDALGIDAKQDGDAMPGAPSALGYRHAGGQPERDPGVPGVVGALGERGRLLLR